MQYLTLTEYAEKIMRNKNNPGLLAEIHIEIATKYAMLSDIQKDIQLEKAIFWDNKENNEDGTAREKSLSDSAVEKLWLKTEGGQKELKLKYELRGLDKLTSAIKSSIVVNSVESRMDR